MSRSLTSARTVRLAAEWFQLDDSKNTKVYVSGLADDTTEDEFVELMSKCGLVMKDPLRKNAWKIKLYRDDYGVPKGDGICTYIKVSQHGFTLSRPRPITKTDLVL